MMANISGLLNDGYDLPIYGLDNGLFYVLHIPAIALIVASFICTLVAIVVSFKRHSGRSFFSWTKSDRFVVYLAVCDGLFNLAHGSDHATVTITKNHVYPEQLCQFYAFITCIFMSAQNILVAIIAVNIFAMMYFHRKTTFGRFDWILLSVTFGLPLPAAIAVWCIGKFGPNGIFCFTDGVKGWVSYIALVTVPLLVILVMNTILYLLTWLKIRSEVKVIRDNLGEDFPHKRTSIRAAKSMSLFVAAFFIQWCTAGIYGAWSLFDTAPAAVLHVVTKFTNIGGILNLCVFIILSRRKNKRRYQTSCRSTRSRNEKLPSDQDKESSNTPGTINCSVSVSSIS